MLKIKDFIKAESELKAIQLKQMTKILAPEAVALPNEYDPYLVGVVMCGDKTTLCYDGMLLSEFATLDKMRESDKVSYMFKNELDLNTLHENILYWQAEDFAGAKNNSTMTKRILKCAEEMRGSVVNEDDESLLEQSADLLLELFTLFANNNVAVQDILKQKLQNININKTSQSETNDGN